MQKPYDELIKAIETAFDGVQLSDSDPTLADCIIEEDYHSKESIEIAKDKHITDDWGKIKDDWIEENPHALCYCTGPSLKFMLPPYLIWTLRNARISDSLTIDTTIYAIGDLTRDKQKDDNGNRMIDLFEPQQLSCIRKFLKFMINQNPDHCDLNIAKKALYNLGLYLNR